MQLDVNLHAVYLTTRDAIPLLKEAAKPAVNGGAMIVNTASIAGKQPQGWLAAYSATKAAVIALTEATGKELANDGVRCTAICPGFVDTPMTDWARGQAFLVRRMVVGIQVPVAGLRPGVGPDDLL